VHLAVEADRLAGGLSDRLAALDGVRLAEEDLDALAGEVLLDRRPPDPVRRRPGGPRRSVGTLRQPDCRRLAVEHALVGANAGAQLTDDRRVAAQQRQIAVRRGAGRDLDVALVLQRLEGADDVAVIPL